MANRFNVLGTFDEYKENQLLMRIRRNFRNYEGEYELDTIHVTLTLGVSKLLLDSLSKSDVIAVSGRIETSVSNVVILVAEHVTRLKDLQQDKIS